MLALPAGVVADATGKMYVADTNLLAFAPGAMGNVAPVQVITGASTMLMRPAELAFDGSGDVVAPDAVALALLAFAPGATGNVAPAYSIAGAATLLSNPRGVTLDAAGNFYIVQQSNVVDVYAAGSIGNTAPIRQIVGPTTQLNAPNGVVLH